MNMRLFKKILITGALVFLLSSPAQAVESGFGLFGGLTNYASEGEFKVAPLTGVGYGFKSSGISFGFDYQFPIFDLISINPFYMSSHETFSRVSGPFPQTGEGQNVILGVQGRLWFGSLYVGAHTGIYGQIIRFDTGDAGWAGNGFGVAAGYETDFGFFVNGQIDSANMESKDEATGIITADMKLSGMRMHAGYRF